MEPEMGLVPLCAVRVWRPECRALLGSRSWSILGMHVCVYVCVSMSDSDPGLIKDEIRLYIMGDYEIPDLGLSED